MRISLSRRLARRPSAAALRAAPFTLALLAAALPAAGQTGPGRKGLDPVVVTATRSPQVLSQVLADMTVITRADIERQAIGSVADLLRTQACFEMVRNGGPGSNTSLFVRGADTRHTTVLIDGVRVDSQASSGASWNSIPLAQIERIEIVRGAASAIYGSDAIGGVVQIFTRKGDDTPQLELGMGAGNRGLAKLDASLTGLSGIFDYAVSVAAERSDGFNTRPTTDQSYRPDDDGYRSRNYSLRVGAQLNAAHRVELSGLNSHVDAQYDASAKPKTDDHTVSDTRSLRGAWLAQWSPALNTELTLGESMERYETKPSPYLTETRVRTYALQGSYQLAPGSRLTGLLERREDKLENTSLVTGPEADRHQNAIGAGWLWNTGPLSLQLHARHDEDSEFGGANTGTVAAGYQFAPAWRLLASYGTAFRAPSLYQRFSEYGTGQLDPEKGKNAELGLHYGAGLNEFSITAYRNLVDDLIIFGAPGPCASEFGCYENVSRGRLQGVSLRGSTVLAGVRLSGSVDFQAPKDVTEGSANYGKVLARRAKQHASLRAETDVAGWTLGSQLLASSDRTDNLSTGYKLGGYATLDLDAQYKLSNQVRLQLKLDNAFDRAYETARGYASSPRQFFVGLRYTPKF
jgi:vitamin B12 transporter